MKDCINLYTISFTVGAESGLALVAAHSEREAFDILKNGGSRQCEGYSLVQIRNLGLTTSCTYGILMESFVNAMEAYNAILQAADHFIKGDKGDSVWVNMYVDDEFYLHVIEEQFAVSAHLDFDESTGYLTIS